MATTDYDSIIIWSKSYKLKKKNQVLNKFFFFQIIFIVELKVENL